MKNLLKTTFVVLVAVCFAGNVHAATEQEVIDHVSESVTINGKSVSIPTATINQLKSYLNDYELSSSDADKVIAYFDEAVSVLKNANATEVSDLTTAKKEELLDLAKSAASVMGISNVSYDKSTGALAITVASTGKTLSVSTATIVNGTSTYKSTGTNYTVYASVSILAILAAIASVFKKTRTNE